VQITTEMSLWNFRDMFEGSSYKNNFNYEQLELLYDELEMLQDDCEVSYNDDIVAICCDYSGYDRDELFNDYLHNIDEDLYSEYDEDENLIIDEDLKLERVLEYIQDNSSVSYDECKNNFIVRVF